jgi:hypothetical protein
MQLLEGRLIASRHAQQEMLELSGIALGNAQTTRCWRHVIPGAAGTSVCLSSPMSARVSIKVYM